MNLGTMLPSIPLILVVFLVGGLAIQGPLEVWNTLAQLATEALT